MRFAESNRNRASFKIETDFLDGLQDQFDILGLYKQIDVLCGTNITV